MADYRATSAEFTAVADAIRTKGGTSAQLTWPNGFVSAVQAIPTGSGVVQPLSVTQNGTYNPPSGVDGYAPVTVNVSGGGGSSFDGTLIGEYNNSSGSVGGKWVSTNHNTTNDLGYVVAYYYNSNLIRIITLKKESVTNPPNGAFENIAAELNSVGHYVTQTAFNMRIVNSILEVSFGSASTGEYSAKVYTCGSALDYFDPLYSE
jgi:hypothetical protein